MTVDIGRTGIWCGVFDAHPTVEVQAACAELEALGYSAVWLPEAVGRDPFVAAATCLAATVELRLATGIANIYARDPMTMSACQLTLAEAFPDRFLLGLGVSHHHLVERLRKHDYSKPLSYMQSYLTAMDGAMFAAVGPHENPGRVLAALGPKMLETAAAQASGAHPYFTTPEHTRRLLTLGFDETDWADHQAPSDRLVDAIVAWGTPDQIRDRVDEHRAAGADHVCVQVLRSDLEIPLTEWRTLADVLISGRS